MTRLCWAKTMLRRSDGSQHRHGRRRRCSSGRRPRRPPGRDVVGGVLAHRAQGELARGGGLSSGARSCPWRRSGSGRRGPPPPARWRRSRPLRPSRSRRARCGPWGRCAAGAPRARAAPCRTRGSRNMEVTLTDRASTRRCRQRGSCSTFSCRAETVASALVVHRVADAAPEGGHGVVAEVVPVAGGTPPPAGGAISTSSTAAAATVSGAPPASLRAHLTGTARPAAATAAARCPPAWRCSPTPPPPGTSRGLPSWPWR